MKVIKKMSLNFLLLMAVTVFGLVFVLFKKKRFNEGKIRSIIQESEYSQLEDFIISQAKVETGNYKSRLFLEARNLFGMRCAKIRPQKRIACFNNYAVFDSYEDSINDYLAWLKYSNFPKSVQKPETFILFLKERKYFTDSYENYLKIFKAFL